jgi:hypothetical protein
MIAIISLLLVLYLSLFITRIATIILVHTGLPRQIAKFQARSAMTGCGYTTSEAEQMLNHPLRRRVIQVLMLLGHIGIVASMSTAIIGFVTPSHHIEFWRRAGILGLGLIVLWFLANSKWFEHWFDKFLDHFLKTYTAFKMSEFGHLFHLTEGFVVSELALTAGNKLIGKKISELNLTDMKITLLGIHSAVGKFHGILEGDITLQENDVLVIYGQKEDLEKMRQDNSAS